MLTPVPINDFGGLNLAADPQDAGFAGAIDLMNVEFDYPGRLRSRDGYTEFGVPDLGGSGNIVGLHSFSNGAGQEQLAVVAETTGFVYAANGDLVASTSLPGAVSGNVFFQDIGTGSANYLAVTTDSTSATLLFNTATWAIDATIAYGGGPLTTTPYDNRLVLCSGSTVRFSDPGDPGTVTNSVDLDPGDGETIKGACTWGNQVFVFKQSKFYVFYGTSELADGSPVFDYRAVRSQQGVAAANCAVSVSEGVYFLSASGLWLTVGGAPKKVSAAIDPFFRNQATPYAGADLTAIGTAAATAPKGLAVADNKVSILTSWGCLSLRRPTGAWSADTRVAIAGTGLNAYSSVPASDGAEGLCFTDGGTSVFIQGDTTDNGTPYAARYRTGFAVLGGGDEVVTRELLLDGYGTVSVAASVNDATTLGTSESVTLGASRSALAQGRSRTAANTRGRNLSLCLSGVAAWGLSSAVLHLFGKEPTGDKSS